MGCIGLDTAKNILRKSMKRKDIVLTDQACVCIPCYIPHWIPRFWMNFNNKVMGIQTSIETKEIIRCDYIMMLIVTHS